MFFHFSKDKKRHAEGTGVVSDPREPAKLGVSFSYCKYLLSLFYQLFDETLRYSCFTEIKLYKVWWSFEITSWHLYFFIQKHSVGYNLELSSTLVDDNIVWDCEYTDMLIQAFALKHCDTVQFYCHGYSRSYLLNLLYHHDVLIL